MSHPSYSHRQQRVRQELRRRGCQAFVVTHLPNVRYLCGFSGSNAALLVGKHPSILLTDGRYATQAKDEVECAKVAICTEALLKATGAHLKVLGRANACVEAVALTIAQFHVLKRSAGQKIRFQETHGIVEKERATKDKAEVSSHRGAAKLICEVFDAILPHIRPGVRETELAAEIEYRMRKLGASGPSFDTIVASGPRSALPHARPTPRKLRLGELVLLDMGAILGGYCSDMTRTVYLGKAPKRISDWYRGVWEAHQAALATVRPGVACAQVDRAARTVLQRHGLEQYFVHSTGHGIGLEIHEAPRLAKGQKAPLAAGNVITIEPGVYLEGVGGIRIEDDVVVTRRGSEVLTRMCGELLQL